MSKACEYIKELRQSNLKLGDDINVLERLRIDNQLLRQEVRPKMLFLGTEPCSFVTEDLQHVWPHSQICLTEISAEGMSLLKTN